MTNVSANSVIPNTVSLLKDAAAKLHRAGAICVVSAIIGFGVAFATERYRRFSAQCNPWFGLCICSSDCDTNNPDNSGRLSANGDTSVAIGGFNSSDFTHYNRRLPANGNTWLGYGFNNNAGYKNGCRRLPAKRYAKSSICGSLIGT